MGVSPLQEDWRSPGGGRGTQGGLASPRGLGSIPGVWEVRVAAGPLGRKLGRCWGAEVPQGCWLSSCGCCWGGGGMITHWPCSRGTVAPRGPQYHAVLGDTQ